MRTSDAPALGGPSHTVDYTAGVGKNEDDISMGNPDEDDVSSVGSVKLWVMPLDTDLSEGEHQSLIFDFFSVGRTVNVGQVYTAREQSLELTFKVIDSNTRSSENISVDPERSDIEIVYSEDSEVVVSLFFHCNILVYICL